MNLSGGSNTNVERKCGVVGIGGYLVGQVKDGRHKSIRDSVQVFIIAV
jgi:hypothetical protein